MTAKKWCIMVAFAAIATIALGFTFIASDTPDRAEGDPGDVEIVYQAISYKLNSTNHKATIIQGQKPYVGDIVIPDSVIYNNIAYAVDGIDDRAFEDYSAMTSIELPDGIITIPDYAFSGCTALKRIKTSAETIGNQAFNNCISLKSFDFTSVTNIEAMAFNGSGLVEVNLNDVVIKDHVFAGSSALKIVNIQNITTISEGTFEYCTGLESVILSGVNEIGTKAFVNCSSLTEITIPSSVTKIGISAFRYCTALSFVDLKPIGSNIEVCAFDTTCALGTKIKTSLSESDVKREANGYTYQTTLYLDSAASFGFNVTYTVGSFTINISDGSMTVTGTGGVTNDIFKNNPTDYTKVITSISLPNGVTTISDEAFKGCTALRTVDMPHNLTSLGSSAFEECKALRSIALPKGITEINDKTFYDCSALSMITLSDETTRIGDESFYDCYSLEAVSLPDSLTEIGKNAFCYCMSMVAVTIPDGVTLGERSFNACYSLRNIVLPSDLKILPEGVFYDVNALSHISLPESLTEIGEGAFGCCHGLLSISIPDKVKTIGSYVFQECLNMESVSIYDSTNLGDEVFSGCSGIKNFTIYVGDKTNTDGGILTKYFSSGTWNLDVGSQVVNHVALRKANSSVSDWGAFTGTVYETAPSDGSTAEDINGDLWRMENGHWVKLSEDHVVPFLISFSPNYTGQQISAVHSTDKFGKLSGLPSISRTGYMFTGWYDSTTGGVEITTSTVFTVDSTVYAHWNENKYTLVLNDGMSSTNIILNYSDSYSLTSPSNIGSAFKYWISPNVSGKYYAETIVCGLSAVNGSTVNMYAVWETQVKYAVSFIGHGRMYESYVVAGSNYSGNIIPDPGYNVPESVTVNQTGYANFQYQAGTVTFDSASSDVIITGTAVPKTYTIVLNPCATGIHNENATVSYKGKVVSGAAHYRVGYDLDGYYTEMINGNKVLGNDLSMVAGVHDYTDDEGAWIMLMGTTLYAKWTVKNDVSYTIRCMCGTETLSSTTVSSKTFGTSESVIAPSISGYTLSGSDQQTIMLDSYGKTVTFEYTANYVPPVKYTVTLVTYATTGSTSFTATEGSSVLEGYTAPSRADSVFQGYWTEPGGTGTMTITVAGEYADNVPGIIADGKWTGTGAYTFYAKWKSDAPAIHARITYHGNGGLFVTGSETITGDSTVRFNTLPSRDGYGFLGWAYDCYARSPDYTTESPVHTVDVDNDLYAVWNANGPESGEGVIKFLEDNLMWVVLIVALIAFFFFFIILWKRRKDEEEEEEEAGGKL